MHPPTDSVTWKDYALLDSGNLQKCERFGDVVLVRPEPQALWAPARKNIWDTAHATYRQHTTEGLWDEHKPLPANWTVSWNALTFGLRLTSFKHVGLFPEHAPNWLAIQRALRPNARVLNLFGYTGAATLAALAADAHVTHVDASKSAIGWARQNAEFSHLATKPVRWILDDARTFVDREVRRGQYYDMVIMDPPAFGRGPKKEVWRFENDFLPLLSSCLGLLSKGGHLFVHAYSMGFCALVIEQAILNVAPHATVTSQTLSVQEQTDRAFLLPLSVSVHALL